MSSKQDGEYIDNSRTLYKVQEGKTDIVILSQCEVIFGKDKSNYCFQLATDSLKSFAFEPNPNLRSIGSYAFYNCVNLLSIDLQMCTKLEYIGEYAFYNCKSVTAITLPEGLQSIKSYCFYNLKITSINIPSTVSSIAKYGIASTTTLTQITFSPNSLLTSIDQSAFHTTSFSSFTVPEKVRSISGVAFYGNAVMRNVYVSNNNEKFWSDTFVVYTKDNTTIVYCAPNSGLTSLTIPDTVTSINEGCFLHSKMESIIIPDSVTKIEGYAFCNMKRISTIVLPAVQTIPNACFESSSITQITIPEGVTKIQLQAFAYCSSLTLINLPSTLVDIGGNAITVNDNLEIKVSGNEVFIDNQLLLLTNQNTTLSQLLSSSITSVVIPSTVKTIRGSAFKDKINLVSVSFDGVPNLEIIDSRAFKGCTKLSSFPISPKLISIGEESFQDTSLSGELNFPSSLTKIGNYAFYNVANIEILSFSSTNNLTIGSYAFSGCSSIKSITLPSNANVFLGNYVFSGIRKVKEFTFTNNIKKSGLGCFMNSSFETFTFENDIFCSNELPSSFFKDCCNLSLISIPSNITTLGTECLSNTGITDLYLPDYVETLGLQCLKDCTSLESVHISSTSKLEHIEFGVFSGC
ncbi:surface antigen BspA-like [Trichomonas vaginalis G3]|uniref:Surface antigen BspA-like n=1 Tax=Trichomonas vaginalis (strain ATCC PRA-98 / G3) TaxID=412133 RepID=A2DUP9_TRIV3|nr:regulation of response to stimulus [Trichomonas vaginalis G3]EAY15940.1 surface antigen BspA-like [Trichomonas vaginalis G3]KAI5506599.1 regulation of response to stimulus [Trichomonas vaginalis G3]|eukprot:XP_001328163.1 surface antigen BspA-like [Trichomonas vaginalis G3]